MLISISSKKCGGKDTLGVFLSDIYKKKGFSVGIYHFADSVKEFCVEWLYLDPELCWGTDSDKETLTQYKWSQMPHYERIRRNYATERAEHSVCTYLNALSEFDYLHNKQMSYREILQHVGTEWWRYINPNYWVERLLKKIKKDNLDYAIICDTRFSEEVSAVKEISGINLRLTRNTRGVHLYKVLSKCFNGVVTLGGDSHISETSLDPDVFNWSNFDYVIDNQNQTLEETQQELLQYLENYHSN